MALEVMHADDRLAERHGQTVRNAGSYEQRSCESRAHGDGHRVNVLLAPARGPQDLVEQWQAAADVITRGELGHHTAVGAVHVDLTVHRVGEQSRVAVEQRDARFITRSFEPENQHCSQCSRRAKPKLLTCQGFGREATIFGFAPSVPTQICSTADQALEDSCPPFASRKTNRSKWPCAAS